MPEESPRRVPRFLSCLVKGPLGCLAFFVGAAIVLVLFLPPACGRIADRSLERWFAERYAGSLELGDVWLGSLYGPQRIDSLILRDPDGEEVLRAELHGPSLAEALHGPTHRYGPVQVRVPVLRVSGKKSGATNLERTFALLPEADEQDLPRERGVRSGLDPDLPVEITLEVVIERLRCADASGEQTLENLRFTGTLRWGPDETHLELEGGTDPGTETELHAHLDVERLELDPPPPWKVTLTLGGAPTVLARSLAAALRPLAGALGARTDELTLERDESGVLVHVADEGASLELAGKEQGHRIAGSEGDFVRLALPCDDARARGLIELLLPVVSAGACTEQGAEHVLRLSEFRWPEVEDWSALAGELELELAPQELALVPEVARLFDSDPLGAALVPAALRAKAHVRDGTLQYEPFRLPLARSGALEFAGTLDLSDASCDLRISNDKGLGLGRLQGTRTALVATPQSPPEAPVPPAGAPDPEIPLPPKSDG